MRLKEGVETQNMDGLLNFVDVYPEDVFFIESGTPHSICEGILIAEIQQSSDTTYRVHDWNRLGDDDKSRPMHVKKALEVIKITDVHGREKVNQSGADNNAPISCGNTLTPLASCRYFTAEKLDIKPDGNASAMAKLNTNNGYRVVVVLEGQGIISGQSFCSGDCFFIPACLESYTIAGACSVIVIS